MSAHLGLLITLDYFKGAIQTRSRCVPVTPTPVGGFAPSASLLGKASGREVAIPVMRLPDCSWITRHFYRAPLIAIIGA